MNLTALAKIIIVLGIILLITGGLIYLLGFFGITRLPGDIIYQKDRTTIYFPIGIGILISIILTVLLNLFLNLKR
jgi:hypothetical protein